MLFSERAAAKDLGRSEDEETCGGFAERVDGEEKPAAAKGLLGPAEEAVEVENGLEFPKGFSEDVPPPAEGLAPNRLSPMCATGLSFTSSTTGFFSLVLCVIRTPLKARMLPSFLLHVFRLHPRT